MKTEQEIKERLEYIKGYKDALSDRIDEMLYSSTDCDIVEFKGQIKALEWVLEDSNDNK